MKLRFKKTDKNAVIPSYAKHGDAGFDLTAIREESLGPYKTKFYFGLAFEIPLGYTGLVFPRSSIHRTDFRLSNCVGVVDSGYRGEVSAVFDMRWIEKEPYKIGDRVAQMVIVPCESVEFEEVDELSETERGENGYGSSGK